MAASDKARALKDSYISAIANETGGEAMAQAGALANSELAGKLGMQVGGSQASTIYNLDNNTVTDMNDGDPTTYYEQNGDIFSSTDEGSAYPIQGGGTHASHTSRMPPKVKLMLQNDIRDGYIN